MATDSRSEATADNGTENPVPSPSPPLQFSHKIALITGITGQDGAYLTEFLLNKGYEVPGLIRKSSNFSIKRVNHIYIDPHNAHKERRKLHYPDLSLRRWLDTIQPDEVYNLAAQSHVVVSFEIPDYIADVVATDALRLLEAVRSHISASGRSHIRYYQRVRLRCSDPPFHRRRSRLHSTPGPPTPFPSALPIVGRIKIELQSKLFLGNLQASRDWGFVGDYVEAMRLMLQQEKPDDYVVATEESHTVEEFVEVALGTWD
ncbi:Hypothetical predicted protein [Olea europaea subsp. europaea]|uniref:GDP-mannose 4,6-dehydratase n=1 Tax=Olea europaea subsp. europaea TaxID=158383 RepID=A0A8S0SS26_OLEEU|nr:Hypothetical predicted protein [Olea europaea subsp. europaea]